MVRILEINFSSLLYLKYLQKFFHIIKAGCKNIIEESKTITSNCVDC